MTMIPHMTLKYCLVPGSMLEHHNRAKINTFKLRDSDAWPIHIFMSGIYCLNYLTMEVLLYIGKNANN